MGLSVATAMRQRYPDKTIVIAGDDDHGTENNPGREKALAAAEAVAGVAIFPNWSAEHATGIKVNGADILSVQVIMPPSPPPATAGDKGRKRPDE
jgi:phage/plasmid primase-like uncharacterized protein